MILEVYYRGLICRSRSIETFFEETSGGFKFKRSKIGSGCFVFRFLEKKLSPTVVNGNTTWWPTADGDGQHKDLVSVSRLLKNSRKRGKR